MRSGVPGQTNARTSDETVASQKTNGRGAAVVDNVTYSISGGASSPPGWGQFEFASDVDNTQNALLAWRTTGRPPQPWGHREILGSTQAPYFDLCGSDPSIGGRLCSAVNGILTSGDHDNLHRFGRDVVGTSDRSPAIAFLSPTISCGSTQVRGRTTSASRRPGNPGDAIAGKEYFVDYEIHPAAANNPSPVSCTAGCRRSIRCSTAHRVWWSNVQRSVANYPRRDLLSQPAGHHGSEGTFASMIIGKFTAAAAENPA